MFVVIGATGRLGVELVNNLQKQGYKVVSMSRRPAAEGVAHIACDLASEGSIIAAAQQLLQSQTPLTGIVLCAGDYEALPLAEVTGQHVARLYTANAIGPTLLFAHLIERIKKDGADIMIVGSEGALTQRANHAVYSASKAALHVVAKQLRRELTHALCRVTTIIPDNIVNNVRAPGIQAAQLAQLMVYIAMLPKNIQVSELRVNHNIGS